MNRIYRIVWNATINRWVVASEVAKGRKKKTSAGDRSPQGAAVMFAASMMVAGGALMPQPAEAFGVWRNLRPGPCTPPPAPRPAPAPAPKPAPAPAPAPADDWATMTHKYFRAKSVAPDANPTGFNAIAVGPESVSDSNASLAVGFSARAGKGDGVDSSYATAIGAHSVATQRFTTAVGFYADANAESALALGSKATASHTASTAIGSEAKTDRNNSVSVGNEKTQRQITHVAAGTEDTDAVNLRQLKDTGLIDNGGNVRRAVLFDGPNGEADFKGRQLINVADGTRPTDAVTLGQMNQAGFSFDNSGKPLAKSVVYAQSGIQSAGSRSYLRKTPSSATSRAARQIPMRPMWPRFATW